MHEVAGTRRLRFPSYLSEDRPLMSSDPDAELVVACQQSTTPSLEGEFRQLYDRFKDRVYNVCYRISGNPTDALDASQETFGIIFRRVSEFRFQSRFSSWVYRIAVNASIDLRRRSRTRRFASLDVVQEASSEASRYEIQDSNVEMPSQTASRREFEIEVQRAIDRLSPKLRTIVVLRYLESLSYEEVSETLKVSLGTVKSRLARAHDALDRELAPVLDKHYLG
ncbi:MAG: RNA polymerase subunit sigma-24 [Planctomycetes bacterium]|nr:RNA polymerase subunit sigma-24 [Planctomycetota bacterium]